MVFCLFLFLFQENNCANNNHRCRNQHNKGHDCCCITCLYRMIRFGRVAICLFFIRCGIAIGILTDRSCIIRILRRSFCFLCRWCNSYCRISNRRNSCIATVTRSNQLLASCNAKGAKRMSTEHHSVILHSRNN